MKKLIAVLVITCAAHLIAAPTPPKAAPRKGFDDVTLSNAFAAVKKCDSFPPASTEYQAKYKQVGPTLSANAVNTLASSLPTLNGKNVGAQACACASIGKALGLANSARTKMFPPQCRTK